jgi:glucokinase
MPEPVPKATKGLLGAGTGLGASIFIFDKEKKMYMPIPSEGGHPDFAATDSFEFELMEFIKKKVRTETPIDNELVLSGRGIVSIYEFLMTKKLFEKNEVTDKIQFTSENEKAAVISKNSRADPACRRTFEIFAKIYAGALRGMAVTLMARGGMYIAGGIAPKNIDFFTDSEFMKEFEKQYAIPHVPKEIPVFVIMNYNVSLYGAANVAINFPELAIHK